MSPSRRSIGAQVLLWVLAGYRWVSQFLPSVCRFYPSCSAYAVEAIGVHGAVRGSALAVRRLLRCHPWQAGGLDPVPERRGRRAGHKGSTEEQAPC